MKSYVNNPLIKASHQTQEFTEEQIQEFVKCANSPEYFIVNYIKIVHLERGLVPFEMYDFQKKMVSTFHENRFTICKVGRQSGKSVTVIAYLLWFLLFNESVSVAMLANKSATSRELLSRMQLAYEHLPFWLQQGVGVWNKGSFELENGSKIISSATSSSAIRGSSFNLVFLDEFAFVENNLAEDFFRSVYPTISSAENTKLIIVSTPYGMNHYYRMWKEAVDKRSNFIPIQVHWSEVPGRDEEWKQNTIKNTSIEQFRQEFETEFIGSDSTLIDPNVLQALRWEQPLINKKGLTIYEEPSTTKLYACTVDVALGKGKDYSAFLIYDITQIPYRVVAVYRDNTITPLVFPNVIHSLVKQYNNAYTLVEIDGSGAQVGDILRHDLGYENLLMTWNAGRNGIQISSGFKRSAMMGLKMTRPVKNIGCMTLKNLVEQEKIILRDVNVITEFYSFAQKGQSFEATPGTHDDLVMCCVSFSWLVAQRYFAELTDVNLRENLLNDVEEETWDSLTPFGFIDDGLMDIPSETQHVAREGNDDWLDNRGTDWL